jgi:hypothetical protein
VAAEAALLKTDDAPPFPHLTDDTGSRQSDHRAVGWMGPYHGAIMTPSASAHRGRGGVNETVWQTYRFGYVRVGNHPSFGPWTLRDDLAYNCDHADVNYVWGGMVGPTGHGNISNPADRSLWRPAATLPGLVQGAHRWSELSKVCPQIAGVEIDDFLNNFRAEGGRRHGAENTSSCGRRLVAMGDTVILTEHENNGSKITAYSIDH